ncbi:unnamed protein product [Lactuca virosa]|uniref:RRM domain-containing protein n=1 Tax=Lactuca virosa TaxID=75947 RepID=A0AAU9MLI4_9ASTR|nr:unnamed protein product [Lactuca virosa]
MDGTEIRSPFTKFGQVVDVFIPRKKNRNGKQFAFIRFNTVKDESTLENALQGIKCNENVLKVNLAKHPRNSSKALTNATHKQRVQPQFQRYANTSGGFRDRRSFAQVASVTVTSLDHNANIPTSLINGDHIKYLGGLNIASAMGSSGDQKDLRFERMAWIKINGLPLRIWDEATFSIIVGRFGRVTHPFDNIGTTRAYSMGKVEDTDEEDAIFETWMQENNEAEPEDGEYRPESIFGNKDKVMEVRIEGSESVGEAPSTDSVTSNLPVDGTTLEIPYFPVVEVFTSGGNDDVIYIN